MLPFLLTFSCKCKFVWKWKASSDNCFKTSKAYDILTSLVATTQSGPAVRESLNQIWSKIPPIKSLAMAWRLLQDRLPTSANLVTRNILPQNGNVSCPFCNLHPETANHLFFECNVSSKIWYACCNWMGVSTAVHSRIAGHFGSFSGLLLGKKGNMISISLWTSVVWIIWRGRNKLIFEGKDFDLEKSIEEIRGRFWSWCSVKFPSFCNSSFTNWLENPRKLLDC